MSTPVPYKPAGFHSVTPYLAIRGAAEAIAFYIKAFGAKERFRLPGPDGKSVGHAEIVIGDSIIMLSDEAPRHGAVSPQTLGGSPVNFAIYVEDVDHAFEQAVAAGASIEQPVTDKFYGDRAGCLRDPFGHRWTLMTHNEEVPMEEIDRRLAKLYAEMGSQA